MQTCIKMSYNILIIIQISLSLIISTTMAIEHLLLYFIFYSYCHFKYYLNNNYNHLIIITREEEREQYCGLHVHDQEESKGDVDKRDAHCEQMHVCVSVQVEKMHM